MTLRFEPLETRFAAGAEPFRVRGLAYVGALEYVDKRFPGGRARIGELLGDSDRDARYFNQLFLVAGHYDISPLVRLYVALAEHVGQTPATFVAKRGRKSAAGVVRGLWKTVLKTSSPEAMAERVHFAFNRYFEPTAAESLSVTKGRFEGELREMPAPMSGFFAASTDGFVVAALELAGGHEVRMDWSEPRTDGALAGVPLERVRFTASWRAS